MQCRTVSSQRPCGNSSCDREECTIARVRMNQTIEDQTIDALRKDHQALIRLYRLIGNSPGFATFTVKEILGALSEQS